MNRTIAVFVAALALAGGCREEKSRAAERADLASIIPVAKPVTGVASDGPHIASGHVDISSIPFEQVVVDQYSFAAIRQSNGDIHGEFEFRAKYSGLTVRAHGEVTCLAVAGNRAKIGGRVTQSTSEVAIPIGSELTWSVTDNGEGEKSPPDTASELLGGNAMTYCDFGLPYPESPVRRGNVQVR